MVERFAVHEVREGCGERVGHVLEASSTHKCSRVLTSTHEYSQVLTVHEVREGCGERVVHVLEAYLEDRSHRHLAGRTTQLSVSTPSEVPT